MNLLTIKSLPRDWRITPFKEKDKHSNQRMMMKIEDRIGLGLGADFANAACGNYAVKCKHWLEIVLK